MTWDETNIFSVYHQNRREYTAFLQFNNESGNGIITERLRIAPCISSITSLAC